MPDLGPPAAGTLVAVATAPATDDQLQSLVVALIAIAVRELFAWWRRRRS